MAEQDKFAAALAKLEKDYGKGTVIGATDKPQVVDVISSGSLGLNRALGVGGFPRGRIVEIYGPESSGKTTLALHVIAEAQKRDPEGKFVFIDAEHALDTQYAANLGVDLDRLLISQPDYGEQGLEVAHQLIKTGRVSVVVIDSVAALTPKAEIDGEIGDSSLGKHARLMSQTLRMLTAVTEKTGTIVIFLNQLREKIGVMFGSPEVTTGGNALKFYASIRLDIRRVSTNTVDEVALSNKVKVKVVKNKVAPPFVKTEFDIVFGKGIDRDKEYFEAAVEFEIIKKSGSWFSYDGNRLGQGEFNVRKLIEDNPDLKLEIENLVDAKYAETKNVA